MYLYMYMCTYIYIHMHAYTYMYIYICYHTRKMEVSTLAGKCAGRRDRYEKHVKLFWYEKGPEGKML